MSYGVFVTARESLNPPSSTSPMSFLKSKTHNGTSAGDSLSTAKSKQPTITEDKRRPSLPLTAILRRSRKRSTIGGEEGDEQASNILGECFLDLPAEIQVVILSYLSITDVLALRLTSRRTLAILQYNASWITRKVLQNSIPNPDDVAIIASLFPCPKALEDSDTYLLQILHRHKVVQGQLQIILTFLHTRVYMLRLNESFIIQDYAPYRPGLLDKLYMSVWLAYHFLLSVQDLVVRVHPSHLSPETVSAAPPTTSLPTSKRRSRKASTSEQFTSSSSNSIAPCPSCQTHLFDLLASYPSAQVLPTHHMIQLILLHLRAAIRTPQTSSIERKIRGWLKPTSGPTDGQNLDIYVLLGGIEETYQVNEMQGSYENRSKILSTFIERIERSVRVNDLVERGLSTQDSNEAFATSPDKPELSRRQTLAALTPGSNGSTSKLKQKLSSTSSSSKSPSPSQSTSTLHLTRHQSISYPPSSATPQPSTAANEPKLLSSLDPPFDAITYTTLSSLPKLETFLSGPNCVIGLYLRSLRRGSAQSMSIQVPSSTVEGVVETRIPDPTTVATTDESGYHASVALHTSLVSPYPYIQKVMEEICNDLVESGFEGGRTRGMSMYGPWDGSRIRADGYNHLGNASLMSYGVIDSGIQGT